MSRHPFVWPSDLYTELQYMSQAELLGRVFSSLIQVARTQVLEGLAVDSETGQLFLRTVTAEQAANILEDNADILTQLQLKSNTPTAASSLFPFHLKAVQQQLQAVVLSNHRAGSKSIVAWDDDNDQGTPLTYCITKDDRDKRFTVVFLNSNSAHDHFLSSIASTKALALSSRKQDDKDEAKKEVEDDGIIVDSVNIHERFYDELFASGKLDEITNALVPLCQAYPKYKIYVTGHHAGAGKAVLAANWWAWQQVKSPSSLPSLPTPISCLTFGTPRVGDHSFLLLATDLECRRLVRSCRIVHADDAMPHWSAWGLAHAGFQVTVSEDSSSIVDNRSVAKGHSTSSSSTFGDDVTNSLVSYPKLNDVCANRFMRACQNGGWRTLPHSSVDMAVYMETVSAYRLALEELDVNEMYNDEAAVGFAIAPLPVEQ